MGGAVDFVGDVISDVVDFAGDVVNTVVDFVGDAFKTVSNVVKNIIKDPLPTILMIAGQSVGIPPYVTSAVITAARGGDLEDVAKSAAVSWASSEFMTTTEFGKDIGAFTKDIGLDFTQSMIDDFNLPTDVATAIGKASTAGLNNAIIGGIRSGITGQDVMKGITSGLTAGAIYSGTDSFFDEINKNPNWGLSDTAIKYIKGSTSSALNAIASGRDPAAAVGNYVAYATMKAGQSEIANQAKKSYNEFKTAADTAEKSQTEYETVKSTYDQKVKDYENLRTDAQPKIDEYNKILNDQYNPFKTQYDQKYSVLQGNIDQYNNYVARYEQYKANNDATNANAMADKANAIAPTIDKLSSELKTFVDANQPMFDRLSTLSDQVYNSDSKMKAILADIQEPSGNNTASQLKAAADKYQKNYDLYKTAEQKAQESTAQYTQTVAELATRDALIDGLNTGAIFATSIDENGNYILNNGLKLATDGRFYEGNQQLFTNASGIDQKEINFTDYNGEMVSFGEDAGRNLSQTDVQHIFQRDFGFVPDQSVMNQFVGQDFTTSKDVFKGVVEDNINQQYNDILGRDATADELKAAITPNGDSVKSAQDQAVITAGIPTSVPFDSQEAKIDFTKQFLTNKAQAEEDSQIARENLRSNLASELVTNLRSQGYSDDDIRSLNQSGKFNQYLDTYVDAYDQKIDNLKEVAQGVYAKYGPTSDEYLTARRNVLDAMATSGNYGVTKREDGSYFTTNFGEIDANTLQPKFVPNYSVTTSNLGRSWVDPVTGIPHIETFGTSTSGLTSESPYAGLFSVGQSAKPPEQGGKTLFGDGSGSVGGTSPLKDYFGGFNLAAVDDKSGAALYEGGNGKALILYSDGSGITIDPTNNEPIWLTPTQVAEVKADISTSGQTPTNVVDTTKQGLIDQINAGYITSDEAQKYLKDKGFPTIEEADIAKSTGMLGTEYTSPEDKLATLEKSYYDPLYMTESEVEKMYSDFGLSSPTTSDITKFMGRTPSDVTKTAIEQYLPTARYNAVQQELQNLQKQQALQSVAQQMSLSQQQAQQQMQAGLQMLNPPQPTTTTAADDTAKFKKPFMTSSITKPAAFVSPLEEFLSKVQKSDYTEDQYTQAEKPKEEQPKQEESMPYYTYGDQTDINLENPFGYASNLLEPEPMIAARGGLATPLMAGGGLTRYGRYAGGGLPVVAHSGKLRVDFRDGNAVTGPGDGQSDDIPAMLADGEFVIPADVVAALGNGSTKAGSDKLYDMMHSVRAYHRSAKPKDLPPEAKASPLDYLKKGRR